MSNSDQITGRCMCGAVTVSATPTKRIIRACHCDMCRQWTSSMFMSIPTDPNSITVTGPVKSFRSSDWAERAFCDTCGSALWYVALHDQQRQLAAGLFENAAGNTLKLEFFSDKVPQGYALTGEHRRMTTDEVMALFAPKDQG